MNFQQFTILGRMVRDPVSKSLPSGTNVCEFGMACSKKYKTQAGEQKEDQFFIDVSAFGRTGEVLAQHGAKGKPFLLTGELRLDQWEKDGQKRSKISMVVDKFQFINDGKRDAEGNGSGGGGTSVDRSSSQVRPARAPVPAARAGTGSDPSAEQGFDEADVPF
jgi:single-strand DNA-binding protein